MEDAAQSTPGEHYPPGVRPPTAAERKTAILQSPEHKAKRDSALAEYNALPLEEKRRRRQEKIDAKIAREAEKLARRGGGGSAPAASESSPDTVRSARGTIAPPPASRPPASPRRVFVTKARTLLDLLGMFELDGQTFIQVTRTSPKTFQGYSCAGVQRPIWEPLDDREFAEIYGGEAYDLRVYRISEDGRRPAALSDTVSYRVAGPPNPESAATNEEESQPMHPNRAPAFMRPNGGRLSHPAVASAEADMLKTQLGHEETMDERRTRQAREDEERRERRLRDRTEREEGSKLETARLMADQRREEMERTERAHERELEAARTAQGSENKIVAELLKTMGNGRGGEESKALLQQHAQDMRQLTEAHRAEMVSLGAAHKETLERITVEHNKASLRTEDNHRQDRVRLEEQVRASDLRAIETVREAQRVADARVADMREENRKLTEDIVRRGEERLKDQKEQWERRFDDLKLSHDRELRAKDSEISLMRGTLEGNAKILLDQKDLEIKRLERDLRDAKKEAEENKDWLGKMSEFEETAEKMGLQRASEKGEDDKEQSVSEIAIKAGMGALQRLPETIAAIGQTIGAVRGQGPPNAALQQRTAAAARQPGMRSVPRMAPAHQAPRLAFATEDSDYAHSTNPHAPSSAPSRPLPPLEPLQDFQPIAAPMAQQQAQPAPQDAPPALQSVNPAPSQPAPAPVQQAATQAPPEHQNQAPPASVDPSSITDEQVLIYMPTLKDLFGSGETPAAVAAYLVENQSIESCAFLLQAVSFERITALAAMNPNAGGVQLSTRDGKKFLQGLWSEMTKLVNAAAAKAAPQA
jgi:hypothetical protein